MTNDEYHRARTRIFTAEVNKANREEAERILSLLQASDVSPAITFHTPQNCQRTYRLGPESHPRLFGRIRDAVMKAVSEEHDELLREYGEI